MEHIGEIIKRQTQTNTSKANTDTWSDANEAQPAGSPDCTVCQGAGFVHPRLPSGKPDFSRVVPCRCVKKAVDKERESRLRGYSHLGALARFTFENVVPEGRSGNPVSQQQFRRAYEAAKAFAAEPKGWLVLLGSSGSGKTHLAAAIVNERIQHNHPAYFQSTPDLLDHLRSAFAPGSEITYDELFDRICNEPLLVLDDLGVQASTAWAKEKLNQLLNHRFNSELPTVITVGVALEELDDRVRTRLTDARLSQVYMLDEKVSALQEYSWAPKFEMQKGMTFKSFHSEGISLTTEQRTNMEMVYHESMRFAESPDGWLVLQGVNGCGKTHLASAIVNYRYEAKKPALFVVVPDLLDYLRSTFSPDSKVSYDQLFESVKNAPFLVLDDLCEQSTTPWAQEKLYQVINHRYNACLPTVITTTYSLDDIEDRISSRLADTKICNVLNITGTDYRIKSDRNSKNRTTRRFKKSGQD